MTVNKFVTYTHQTLLENSTIVNGPIYRRDPNAHESISAFVRRCVNAAQEDFTCVAVAVYAPSDIDIRCVWKKWRHQTHDDVTLDLHETEPQEACTIFVKTSILSDGYLTENKDEDKESRGPKIVITEVDSATSAKGFLLEQPTSYEDDEPYFFCKD